MQKMRFIVSGLHGELALLWVGLDVYLSKVTRNVCEELVVGFESCLTFREIMFERIDSPYKHYPNKAKNPNKSVSVNVDEVVLSSQGNDLVILGILGFANLDYFDFFFLCQSFFIAFYGISAVGGFNQFFTLAVCKCYIFHSHLFSILY